MHAFRYSDAVVVVATALFAASMITLYLASTLYHAFPPRGVKRAFRAIEHSAKFLLIAGTYTPFTLAILRGWLSVDGCNRRDCAQKIWKTAHSVLSTVLYMVVGWLIAVGLSYSVGVAFFALDARIEIRSLHLASLRSLRERMPLFCRALVCRLVNRSHVWSEIAVTIRPGSEDPSVAPWDFCRV